MLGVWARGNLQDWEYAIIEKTAVWPPSTGIMNEEPDWDDDMVPMMPVAVGARMTSS